MAGDGENENHFLSRENTFYGFYLKGSIPYETLLTVPTISFLGFKHKKNFSLGITSSAPPPTR